MMINGSRIEQLRIMRGLTQAALAEQVGVAQATISKLELGQRPNPGMATVLRIAEVLNVPVSDLYTPATLPTADAQPVAA